MGFKKYGPSRNLLNIEPGMLDADNWTLRPAATATYFMYYLLSEETIEILKNIGTVAGTTYLITGGSYYSGEILAITSSMKQTGVTTAERLLQNDGTPLQYSADVSGYTNIYLCIGYGPGITSSNKQILIDSMFDNYNIMLNAGTVPLPYEPYGNIWQPIMPKKLKGIPYSGTLPATLTGTKAGYLHRYKIYGNTSQEGTPTPENPIEPSECGERTVNLFNINATDTNNGYDSTGRYLTNTGAIGGNAGGTWRISEYITIEPNSEYILSGFTTGVNPSYCLYDNNKDFISGARYASESVLAITTPSNARYLRFSRNINTDDVTMLVEGSTAPTSYEPYGYKLPLTSGGTPVDIYIDEPLRKIGEYADYIDYGTGKIVRQIKKVVLTGTEDWITNSAYYQYTFDSGNKPKSRNSLSLSTHLNINERLYVSTYRFSGSIQSPSAILLINYDNGSGGVEVFKQFLANQYANGTPVTIWYVLGTPVEESPTVPFPQIPTSATSTTISWAGEGLAPSQFDSIQEWVNIPTYTRVNGKWVADNSN